MALIYLAQQYSVCNLCIDLSSISQEIFPSKLSLAFSGDIPVMKSEMLKKNDCDTTAFICLGFLNSIIKAAIGKFDGGLRMGLRYDKHKEMMSRSPFSSKAYHHHLFPYCFLHFL